MSLCLAAICDSGQAIACVFDEQWTTVHSAAGGLSKGARINEHWLLFYAGDDVRQVGSVYDRVKRQLLKADGVTLKQAQEAVRDACDEVVNEDLAHGPLRPIGVTVHEFFRNSHQLVADDARREALFDQIAAARLGSEFLLVGFDDRGLPHVVALTDDGQSHNFDRRGFLAVGSGEAVSSHYLAALGYSRHLPVQSMVYAISAAKFIAESATVGKKTHVAVLRRDGGPLLLTKTARVRALWERHGRPRLPIGIEDLMPPLKPLRKRAKARRAGQPVRKSAKRGRSGPTPWPSK